MTFAIYWTVHWHNYIELKERSCRRRPLFVYVVEDRICVNISQFLKMPAGYPLRIF